MAQADGHSIRTRTSSFTPGAVITAPFLYIQVLVLRAVNQLTPILSVDSRYIRPFMLSQDILMRFRHMAVLDTRMSVAAMSPPWAMIFFNFGFEMETPPVSPLAVSTTDLLRQACWLQ